MGRDERSVWLDMDPGIDDCWALIIAAARARLNGVSAVAGNAPLANTYGNARKLLQLLGLEPTLALPGAENPLLGRLISAPDFHGKSGVGDWVNEPVAVPLDSPRVWDWWIRHHHQLCQCDLIATGPLTNLAVSLLSAPQLGGSWKSVTCMCGATPGSQVDKAQEFNIYVDPHAADIVFHWMENLRLIGINVAHRALIPLADLPRLRQYGKIGQVLGEMLNFYSRRARGEGGDLEAFPVDDVVAVASAIEPDLFRWQELPLAVVREGPLRGTVVISPIDLKRKPVKVAVDVDVEGFRHWVWESMDFYLG